MPAADPSLPGPIFAGFDLGGTSIKLGLVDADGEPLAFATYPTEVDRGPEAAVERMADELAHLASNLPQGPARLQGIGLGCPGLLDLKGGRLVLPVNLTGWAGFPIRDQLARATGRPVTLVNDASAAALAEAWVGSGREFSSILMLTLGTGVGGGLVVDNRPVVGAHGFAGEVGHVPIDSSPEARLCGCGRRGCLEAYCSATALMSRAAEELPDFVEPRTPVALAQRAESGDVVAERLILEVAERLAVGCVIGMHILDPGAIILGGAMTFGRETSPLGRRFLDHVRQAIVARTFPALAETLVVRYASLGGNAGYLGAAACARMAWLEPSQAGGLPLS